MSVLSEIAEKVGRGARGTARLPRTVIRRQISSAVNTARSLPSQLKDLAVYSTLGPIPALLGGLINEGADDQPRRSKPRTSSDVPTGAPSVPMPDSNESESLLARIWQNTTQHTEQLERANILGARTLDNTARQITLLQTFVQLMQKSIETSKEAMVRQRAAASDDSLVRKLQPQSRLTPSALSVSPGETVVEQEGGFLQGLTGAIAGVGTGIFSGIAAAFGSGAILSTISSSVFNILKTAIKKFPLITMVYSIFDGIYKGWKKYSETGSFTQALSTAIRESVATLINTISFGLIDREQVYDAFKALDNLFDDIGSSVSEWIKPLKDFFQTNIFIKDAFAELSQMFSNLATWAEQWVQSLADIEIPSLDFLGFETNPVRPFAFLENEPIMKENSNVGQQSNLTNNTSAKVIREYQTYGTTRLVESVNEKIKQGTLFGTHLQPDTTLLPPSARMAPMLNNILQGSRSQQSSINLNNFNIQQGGQQGGGAPVSGGGNYNAPSTRSNRNSGYEHETGSTLFTFTP